MKYGLSILLVLVLFSSCEEKIDWNLKTRSLPLLVVEGSITNEKKAHTVKISRTVSIPNLPPEPVSGALVAITFDDSVVFLQEDLLAPGLYKTDPNLRGVAGKTYGLYIRYQGHEFSANDYMPPVGSLGLLRYHKITETDNLYELNDNQSDDPALVSVYLDWSWMVPPENKPDAKAYLYFYTLNSIDVNEFFKPDKERVVFPVGTIVVRRKYSLSPHYQEFLRSMLMETEWKGGIFDVLPANVNSNIEGNAVGFFSASTVISDTLIFNP